MEDKLFEKVYANIVIKGFDTIMNSEEVDKQVLETIQSLKEKHSENSLVGAFILGLEHGLDKRKEKEREKQVGNRIEDLKKISDLNKDTEKGLGR